MLTKPREPKNKNKEEYIVTFESKQVRDAIKANASNLANHRETAGMRQHVPDHLQKDFHTLMKQRHSALKRNIKFDEEDNGLFMDIKLKDDSDWKRVKPHQAGAANKKRMNTTRQLEESELRGLLGGRRRKKRTVNRTGEIKVLSFFLTKTPNGPHKNMTKICLINANARSIRPKKESLLDCFREMEVDIRRLGWVTSGRRS